ncbi:MAG: hypothetical protein ACLRSW_14760 [Christensenellaceae bacterium]
MSDEKNCAILLAASLLAAGLEVVRTARLPRAPAEANSTQTGITIPFMSRIRDPCIIGMREILRLCDGGDYGNEAERRSSRMH